MQKKNTVVKSGKGVVSISPEGATVALAPLLTVSEVAELLRCSVSSLNKWRLTGDGPSFVYVGRRVRYRPVDVASFVSEGVRESTSSTA
jgi:hypothetical protein